MADRAKLPLLFLDVDGTLLPVGGAHARPLEAEAEEVELWQGSGNPLLAAIDRRNGPRLRALPCELVWATAWLEDANEVIGPLLGLPELPVVGFPDRGLEGEFGGDEEVGPLHWKTRALVEVAEGRPFAWVDDEIGPADRDWVAAHHPGRALLHRVDPEVGLAEADFGVLGEWFREVAPPDGRSGPGLSSDGGPACG